MAVNNHKSPTERFIKYWLPVIIYAILIFYISSIPGTEIPKFFKGQEAIFHILEYAFFALLINRALKEYFPTKTRIMRLSVVFGLAIIYAISDEVHQSFIPYRLVSIGDITFDGIGIFLANILSR
jgi:VanZ family protein